MSEKKLQEIQGKNLEKKTATLLVKGNVNTPFTQIFKQNFEV